MQAGGAPGPRVALVDSDALQRICTSNSLAALAADCVSFRRIRELLDATHAGQRFDAVILGLHADAEATVACWPELEDAVGRAMPVLFLAHHTELGIVHRLPAAVLAQESFRLMASPVDEGALRDWLDMLRRPLARKALPAPRQQRIGA